MCNILGYTGSVFMVIFSFTFNPYFAIAGLILITVQTAKVKLHNLTVVNIISIIGFISQIA